MPNPRCSSACGCTCVLIRIDHCLVTLSCLPCAYLCKVRSRISDALSQALCPRNLTSFTRPFLAGRHMLVEHETSYSPNNPLPHPLLPPPIPLCVIQVNIWLLSNIQQTRFQSPVRDCEVVYIIYCTQLHIIVSYWCLLII